MPAVLTTRAPAKRRQSTPAIADRPRRRGRPARLSRPLILAKALALVDDEGAEALTMRRLGAELGVEAMSLYRHVENKRALLDGIAEQLMAEVDDGSADPSLDWAAGAHHLATRLRGVALAHPAAFELVGTRALNTHAALRPVEALLDDLRRGGFAPDQAVAAYRLLVSYVRGFALGEIAGFTLAEATSDPARLTGDKLPAAEFPVIYELAADLSLNPSDEHFHSGLETILDGLHQRLAPLSRCA
jgi:AcrR family transcriptional regulator